MKDPIIAVAPKLPAVILDIVDNSVIVTRVYTIAPVVTLVKITGYGGIAFLRQTPRRQTAYLFQHDFSLLHSELEHDINLFLHLRLTGVQQLSGHPFQAS